MRATRDWISGFSIESLAQALKHVEKAYSLASVEQLAENL
jgi:hypothetical protein